MNTMTIERIAHEEAQKAADKAGIADWTRLIDFCASKEEVYRNVRDSRMDEDEARKTFAEYFGFLADELSTSDREEEADDAD